MSEIAEQADRPFRVLGIQQVAIGGLDKGALSGLWTGLLGVEKVGDYVAESENVDEDILRLGHGPHAVEIDLMQPLDPDVAPKVHVPTLNHLGLWIDDLAGCRRLAHRPGHALHARRDPPGRIGPRRVLPAPEGQRGDAPFRRRAC